MGSLGTTSRLAAFTGQVYKKGLDLGRCKINNDEGTFVTTDAATLRAGQFVTMDASGFIVPSTGTGVIGISKWDKQTLGVSVNVDEAIVLNGTTATNLRRANVSNVAVRSAANMGGTLYTGGGTDYTANTTNGTIARVALGAIADGATVYVTYTYNLTDADFEIDGKTFRNQSNNRIQGQENRCVVITGWSRIFTMEYNTSVTYATATSNFKLYCTSEGKASSAAANDLVGRVIQLPTSDDQYLGMIAHGNGVVA